MTDCEWMEMSCLFQEVLFENEIYCLLFSLIVFCYGQNKKIKLKKKIYEEILNFMDSDFGAQLKGF